MDIHIPLVILHKHPQKKLNKVNKAHAAYAKKTAVRAEKSTVPFFLLYCVCVVRKRIS